MESMETTEIGEHPQLRILKLAASSVGEESGNNLRSRLTRNLMMLVVFHTGNHDYHGTTCLFYHQLIVMSLSGILI